MSRGLMIGKQQMRASALIAIAMVLAMQGCASYRVHRFTPANAQQHLAAGDEVVLTLKTGKRYAAVVVSIDESTLVTKNGRYAWSDIAQVTIKEVDVAATTAQYVFFHLLLAGVGYLVVNEVFED